MLLAKKKSNKIIESRGDRVLSAITTVILVLLLIIVGYPIIYVVSCSFSSGRALELGRVYLWPVEPTLAGYEFVFKYRTVWIGYRNTIFYTIFGVLLTLSSTIACAYPLSRPNYQGKNVLLKYFLITTFINAGMIPVYIIKCWLGLKDTIWAVLTAGMIGFTNMVILRTAFRSVPGELFDAAAIDGAGEFQTMMQVALPLIKATTNVILLYSAVGCWNDYWNAMIYLDTEELYPLQLFLRTILTAAQSLDKEQMTAAMMQAAENGTKQIQYALIVVSTAPVLILYFAIQKSFKQGVMIGSVKG